MDVRAVLSVVAVSLIAAAGEFFRVLVMDERVREGKGSDSGAGQTAAGIITSSFQAGCEGLDQRSQLWSSQSADPSNTTQRQVSTPGLEHPPPPPN